MSLLKVENLCKSYKKHGNKFFAVKNLSFDIENGECVGLVGESGCGKSTTAYIIARLIKEDSGNIYFNDKKINSSKLVPDGKNIQMIFQNPADSFDPRDTLINGIMQGAASYKIYNNEELKKISLELFDYVGLKKSYANVKISELSGGECQRAAIARALICSPKLLICDEATSALDVIIQAQIVELIRKMKNESKMSILFITHDIPLAASICDRIAVMKDGTIVEFNKSGDVINNPKSSETKKLINSILTI